MPPAAPSRPALVPERSDFLEGDAPAADKVEAFLARALEATGSDAPTTAAALVPWICDALLSNHSVKAYGRDLMDFVRQMQAHGVTPYAVNPFCRFGNYCLSSVSKVVPIEEYQATLLATLKATLKEIRDQLNWRKEHHVRLVFHAFKPLKDAETEAVKELMESLGEYKVDYAFLHVIEDHPYLVFDEKQEGVRDFEGGATKGVMAPTEAPTFGFQTTSSSSRSPGRRR